MWRGRALKRKLRTSLALKFVISGDHTIQNIEQNLAETVKKTNKKTTQKVCRVLMNIQPLCLSIFFTNVMLLSGPIYYHCINSQKTTFPKDFLKQSNNMHITFFQKLSTETFKKNVFVYIQSLMK